MNLQEKAKVIAKYFYHKQCVTINDHTVLPEDALKGYIPEDNSRQILLTTNFEAFLFDIAELFGWVESMEILDYYDRGFSGKDFVEWFWHDAPDPLFKYTVCFPVDNSEY
jgi:hypothetical protein